MNLDDQRAELKAVRVEIAERNQELANRLLDARILRLSLESAYRSGAKGVVCSSQKAAEDAAKSDPEYLQHERETARLTYERDVALGDAESRAYGIQAAIHTNGALV